MLIIPDCEIRFEDDYLPKLDHARATVFGVDNGVCQITIRDGRRHIRIDRLLGAGVVQHGRDYTVTGVSEHMVEMIGVPEDEAVVTLTLTPTMKGCRNCP